MYKSVNYLQVIVEKQVAISANGQDLARDQGFFEALRDLKRYPSAYDYFRYLGNQGWDLVSSNQINFTQCSYMFKNGVNYLIEWKGDKWWGINSTNNEDEDYGNYEDE